MTPRCCRRGARRVRQRTGRQTVSAGTRGEKKKRDVTVSIMWKDGFDFGFDPAACTDCPSHCYRGKSGRVWLSQQEIFQICSFLNMNPIDFIQTYLMRMENRLSIKERHSGHDFECVFLEGSQKKCSIYAVRPDQYRRFPFWDYFRKHTDQAVKECPGVRG